MKTAEMECVLASWFDYRKNLIVPNVYWRWTHELDLMIVSERGYVTEVEIKISRADLRRDLKKWHGHFNPQIKYLYFAVPAALEAAALELVPEDAGILLVYTEDERPYLRQQVKRRRQPKARKTASPVTDHERYRIARLGALRIWGLKRKLEKVAAIDTNADAATIAGLTAADFGL